MNHNPHLRYLPVAPVALIAALAFEAKLPGLIDVRVSKDSGILFEVIPTGPFSADSLLAIASVCGCDADEIELHAGDEKVGSVVVTVRRSKYDFSSSFAATPAQTRLVGGPVAAVVESDESYEASEALFAAHAASRHNTQA